VRRTARLPVALEDALTDDVASWGAATERANDLGAKMIDTVCQGFGIGDTRDCQDAGNGHEQG
jgi:hypothetical protein